VERTVPAVIAAVAGTLPLRSAIFILETGGAARTIVSQLEAIDSDRLQTAKAHARNSYAHLVGAAAAGSIVWKDEGAVAASTAAQAAEPVDHQNFIMIPFAIEHRPIFGALQVEGSGQMDEMDLVFVNAVVNQMAIALDRHASEEKVRIQLDFTRAVTGSLGEGVLVVDLVGRVTLLNAAAAQMLGWPEAEALGHGAEEVVQIHRADGTLLAAGEYPYHTVIRTGDAILSEDRLFSSQGRPAFPVRFTCAALKRSGQVSGAVIAFQDVTERKRVEHDNARLYEQAQKAVRAREDLLGVVSHDLKNPLGVILLNLGLIEAAPGGDDRRHSHTQIERIKRSADHMNLLIEDLLDTASIDAGKLSLERRRVAVTSFVNDMIEAMQPLAQSKSLQLKTELQAGLPAIFADADRLQQVFANLLSNAIKFTPASGVITIRAEDAGDLIQFSVTDTGSGILAEEIPRLFERFWQARGTAHQGTGLGLSIARGIVLAHGGRIWVESQMGKGSTFFFTLPTAP
jgi:PAS domain S-box-containing protein